MQKISVGEYFKSLRIMHKGILTAVLLLSFVAVFITNKVGFEAKFENTNNLLFKIIAPAFGIISLLVGAIIFKKRIDVIVLGNQLSISNKLHQYRIACIVRWVLLEVPMLLCAVFLFLTADYYYLFISFALLIFYVLYAPSKMQLINHLQLSTNEQVLLEDEYAEIG